MRRALVAALALLSVLAGCVGPDPGEGADRAGLLPGFVDPILEEHDHADLAAHALAPRNMKKLGYASLGEGDVGFTQFGEMDLHGTRMVVAAGTVSELRPAIVLVDATDPANLTRLGWAGVPVNPPLNGAHPLDVKFDERGEFVYVSLTTQILVYDVRDPTAPTLASAAPTPGAACHMSAMGVVDGTEYFWCTGDPVGLTAYRIVEADDRRVLVPVSQSRPDGFHQPVQDAGTFGVVGAPHDMTFQLDPVDGTPLLVVSNRGFGVRVLDVSDPALPKQLGAWRGEGAEHTPLHWHTSMVALVNGTRYLVTSPEILPDDTTPPAIWLLDATDYADLKLVAEWTAPGDHPSPGGFTFTTHQWQVAQDKLYLAYYHAGVWVLDLKAILAGGYEDDPARPDVLGYILPDMPPVVPGDVVPNTWDINLKDGVIYATDIGSGLYAYHHLSDTIGEEALTGFS